jgi:outer membrane protein FlgP
MSARHRENQIVANTVLQRMYLLAGLTAAVGLGGCSVSMHPPNPQALVPMAPPAPMVERVVETKAVPVIERRSAIRATGYAVISIQASDVPAQQRLLAIRASKLDAYRGLTEQVYGQYLDATTTVADMSVMSDTFRVQVEGVIYGARVVSIAPVGEDTYETTLSLDQSVVDDLRSLYLAQMTAGRS